MLDPSFPVVHDQLLCLADIVGEVVVLSPHCQVSDLLSIGSFIAVGDQANNCRVVRKLHYGVEVVHGHAVVGKQGVQEGNKHGALRGPRVEGQCDRCAVAYPHLLGARMTDLYLGSSGIQSCNLSVTSPTL